jgi:hypothetical protein
VREHAVPFGWPDAGVNPDTRRTPAWCSRPTKSHRACSICSAVIPIRSIIAFIIGRRGIHQLRVDADGGTDRDAASCQGRYRLLADLPEAAVGDARAMLDAIDSDRDRLLHSRCSMRMLLVGAE